MSAAAQAYSANAPRQKPSTSSPIRSPRTFAPAASTTPAASTPATRAFGLVSPTPISRATSGSPRRMCQSAGLSAAACTRTSTSPAPTSGRSVSASRRTSGGPNLSWTTAFIGSRLMSSRRVVVIDTRPPYCERHLLDDLATSSPGRLHDAGNSTVETKKKRQSPRKAPIAYPSVPRAHAADRVRVTRSHPPEPPAIS